jgi:hypothetical protein
VQLVRGLHDQYLIAAERRLREQEQWVSRQVEIVYRLAASGFDITLAEQTLSAAKRLLDGLKRNHEFLRRYYCKS